MWFLLQIQEAVDDALLGGGPLRGENQQIMRSDRQSLLSHLVPRTEGPQWAVRYFLSSLRGTETLRNIGL